MGVRTAAGVDPDPTLEALLRELDQKMDELRHARNESFVAIAAARRSRVRRGRGVM